MLLLHPLAPSPFHRGAQTTPAPAKHLALILCPRELPAAREEVTTQQNVPPPPFPAALARLPAARHRIFDAFDLGRFRLDDNGHRVAGREKAGTSASRTKDRVGLTHTAPVTRRQRQRHGHRRSNQPSRSASETNPGTWTRLAAPFLPTAARSLPRSHPISFSANPTGRKKPGHARRQIPTNSLDSSEPRRSGQNRTAGTLLSPPTLLVPLPHRRPGARFPSQSTKA